MSKVVGAAAVSAVSLGKSIRFLAQIATVLSFVFWAKTGVAEPDLLIDGTRLADEVGEWWRGKYPSVRQTNGGGSTFTLETNLGEGESFSPSWNPQRLALKRWMMTQPDGSIEPHALAQKAIELAEGDIVPGLKLAWDVLRERNGYFSPVIGNDRRSTEPNWTRNFQPHTMKLADLTGEREKFDGNYVFGNNTVRGDNFGAWYHFFGTALFSYYYGKRYPTWVLKIYRGLVDWMVTRRYDQIDTAKRIAIDFAGHDFGLELARQTARGKTVPARIEKGTVAEGRPPYFRLRPDVFGPRWRLQPGQPAGTYGAGKYKPSGAPTMTEEVQRGRLLIHRDGPGDWEELTEKLRVEIDYWHRNPRNDVSLPSVGKVAGWIWALGERQDAKSLALLARLATEPKVGYLALEALRMRGEAEAAEIALRAIESAKGVALRNAYLALMGKAATPSIELALREGMRAGNSRDIREAAATAAENLTGDISETLAAEARSVLARGEARRRVGQVVQSVKDVSEKAMPATLALGPVCFIGYLAIAR